MLLQFTHIRTPAHSAHHAFAEMKQTKKVSMRLDDPADPITGRSTYATLVFTDGTTKRIATTRRKDSDTIATSGALPFARARLPPSSSFPLSTLATSDQPGQFFPPGDPPNVFSRDHRFQVHRLALVDTHPTLFDNIQLFFVSNSPCAGNSDPSQLTWSAVEVFVISLHDQRQAAVSRCSSCPDMSFPETSVAVQQRQFSYPLDMLHKNWCVHSIQAAAFIHHGLFDYARGIDTGTCDAIVAHCTRDIQQPSLSLAMLLPDPSFIGGAYISLEHTLSFKYLGGQAICAGCTKRICWHHPILQEVSGMVATVVARRANILGPFTVPEHPRTFGDLCAVADMQDDLSWNGDIDGFGSMSSLNGGSLFVNGGADTRQESTVASVFGFGMVDTEVKDPTQYDHEVVSTTRYSLSKSGMHNISLCSTRRDGRYSQVAPRSFAPHGIDLDRPPRCTQCGSQMEARKNYNKGWVITRCHLFSDIAIAHVSCTKKDCGYSVSYDGHKDALVNHSNYLLIDAQLLVQAAHLWKAGTAVKVWWESFILGYQGQFSLAEWDCVKEKLYNMRGRISKAIIGFLTICDYPQVEWCSCPQLDRVCVDGLVASCETRRMPKFDRPYYFKDTSFPKLFERKKRSLWSMNGCSLSHAVRVMLRKELAKGSAVSYSTLLEHCAHAGINLILYFLHTDDRGATVYIPKDCGAITNLALTLGKDVSPALQVLPRRVWPTVHAYLTTGTNMDSLHESAPLIAQLVTLVESRIASGGMEWQSRAEGARGSLKEFIRGAYAIAYNTANVDLSSHGVVVENLKLETSAIQELLKYGDYFPRRPILCRIPTVEPEKKSKVDGGETVCTKNAKGMTRLSSGVFLWWCLDCSNSVGFSVLDSAESPHHAFSALRTRFEKPPSVVVYDNACNLSEYCLNRDPLFFSDTLFLVDALHFANHVNCSPVFAAKQYRSMNGVSTVMHEQKNSLLCRLKELAPLMSYQTLAYLLCFAVTFA